MTVDDLLRDAAHDLRADVHSAIDPESALQRIEESRPARRPSWTSLAAALVVVLGLVSVVLVATADDAGDPVTSGPAADLAPGESVGLTMTATPSTGLVDGDTVELTAEGLPVGRDLALVLCPADAFESGAAGSDRCEIDPPAELRADDTGHLDGSIVVDRFLTRPGPAPLDCAAEDVRCAVGVLLHVPLEQTDDVESFQLELLGLVAIDFAPREAPAGPTVSVTPSEGLRHGQAVAISGEGFGGPVSSATICTGDASSGGPWCTSIVLTGAGPGSGDPVSDERGRFEVEVPVWRAIPTYDADGRARILDCAVETCTLQAVDDDGRAAAPVPLRFDPALPLPGIPTVQVEPATGLRPGDPITVSLRGLADGQWVLLGACSAPASEPELGPCSQTTLIREVVGDADGEVTVDLPAVDPGQYGVDCTEPESCGVTVMEAIGRSSDPLLNLVEPAWVQYAPR